MASVTAIPAYINGRAYDWEHLRIQMLGRFVMGVSKLDYSDTQEMVNNYGIGSLPVSHSKGKYEAQGTIMLDMKELVALQNTVPTRRIQDIPPFDINVFFVSLENKPVRDTLKGVRFKTNGRSMSQGSSNNEFDIPLLITEIVWGKTIL